MITIEFKKIHPNALIPRKAHQNDAAFDISVPDPGMIESKSIACIQTGISLKIPIGYYGSIVSRSGLAMNHLITVLTGTIDSNFTGEISLVLYNLSSIDYYFPSHSKLAQLLILPTLPVCFNPVFDFSSDYTADFRGYNGLGSTGGF